MSRKTVTKWKEQGRLSVSGNLVDVEASQEMLLDGASKRAEGRAAPVTPAPEVTGQVTPRVTPQVTPRVTAAPEAPRHDGAAKRSRREESDDPIDADAFLTGALAGEVYKLADSERVKETALAIKQMLAARQAAGELIEFARAEEVLFNASRASRDSWLNWPSRVGPLIAADLGIAADLVTDVLSKHVQSHLDDLGEPEANFTS